jgi:uncharacterized membrane protein HdeD (DUF308 family)
MIDMKKFFDLRFVIGIFFITVGILLLAYHFLSAESKMTGNVNLWSGALYFLFGALMIIFSYSGKTADK